DQGGHDVVGAGLRIRQPLNRTEDGAVDRNAVYRPDLATGDGAACYRSGRWKRYVPTVTDDCDCVRCQVNKHCLLLLLCIGPYAPFPHHLQVLLMPEAEEFLSLLPCGVFGHIAQLTAAGAVVPRVVERLDPALPHLPVRPQIHRYHAVVTALHARTKQHADSLSLPPCMGENHSPAFSSGRAYRRPSCSRMMSSASPSSAVRS